MRFASTDRTATLTEYFGDRVGIEMVDHLVGAQDAHSLHELDVADSRHGLTGLR